MKKEIQNDILIIKLPIRMGIGFCHEDYKLFTQWINEWNKNIILDMAETRALDSSSIGLILGKYKELGEKNYIVIANVRPVVIKILEIVSIDKLLKIFDSIDEAMEFLK